MLDKFTGSAGKTAPRGDEIGNGVLAVDDDRRRRNGSQVGDIPDHGETVAD